MNQMTNIVTEEEFNLHIQNLPKVLAESDSYMQLINNHELDIREASTSKINPLISEALNISLAVIGLLVRCKSEVLGNSNKNISDKILLIASFLQGVQVSKDLILRGQYIKAAAALKQDFELMTRLRSINKGNNKYGLQPNAANAPDGLRFIYGLANDIAHISKDDVLKFYVGVDTPQGLGVTPVPQFKQDKGFSFLLYLSAITFEILTEAIETHNQQYGIDSCYRSAWIYHKYLTGLFKQIEESGTKSNKHQI
jgi:hypothetical protein